MEITLCSDKITDLAKAMIRVQQSLRPALKDGINSYTNSSYATLGSVMEVCRAVLLKHDIWMTQYPVSVEKGHLTPRKIPMTSKLFDVLSRMYTERDSEKPWVFWHKYWSRKQNDFVEGPYQDRKALMRKPCKKAGVRYFRYYALRHSGASTMDSNNVPIGSIQRILSHENRSTTEIYLHSIGNEERDAMLAYERARKNSHTK